MTAPNLKLVDADHPAICGAETQSGAPCQNRPVENGRCWLPGHQDPDPSTADLPEPPAHLAEIGRQYWRYHTGRCQRAGVMDLVDLTVIEKASEVAEIQRNCWENVQKHGPSVPDKNTGVKTNPALSKYNSLMSDYRQLTKMIDGWVAKGSPSGEPEPDDPWSEW